MTKAARGYVIFVGTLSICVAGLLAVKAGTAVRKWREIESLRGQGTVIRRPNSVETAAVAQASDGQPLANIAPFASVTVSSVDAAREASGEGVADGIVDTREWMSASGASEPWIILDWGGPALIREVDLYDRLSPEENVLGGVLTFDDGSTILVGALPVSGTAAQIKFPPKIVHWIKFEIDNAQGKNAGLAEIMVRGTLNP